MKHINKNCLICEKNEEKTVKEVKLHKFFVCACKSQDFALNQKNFARSHDREIVTFINSDWIRRAFLATVFLPDVLLLDLICC